LADPMMDARSMVFLKRGAKMGDRLMVALVDRCYVDALPLFSPIFTS
jgi:hypothetical protein